MNKPRSRDWPLDKRTSKSNGQGKDIWQCGLLCWVVLKILNAKACKKKKTRVILKQFKIMDYTKSSFPVKDVK